MEYFIADGRSTAFVVPRGVIVEGTESLYVNDTPVGRRGYLLDPVSGILWLKVRPAEFDRIRLTYASNNWDFNRFVSIRRLPADSLSSLPAAVRTDTSRIQQSDSGLGLSGEKLVAVTLGGANSGIDQITSVAASGAVDGWSVQAELSDQSSPILSEGTSLELEEIERIYVDVTGHGWHGHFGDSRISPLSGTFGVVDRGLLGGVVERELGHTRFSAAYGAPRGEYGEEMVEPLEGVGGPYRLGGAGAGVRIVPGSEEVYLDGRSLTRGWDADYVIDYEAAELDFMSRLQLTARSRVKVRYQYVTDAYQRDILSASGELAFGGFSVRSGLLREGDNPRRSLAEDLSEDEIAVLAAVAGDSGAAWLDGAEEVRTGDGDYVRDGIAYRFVGAGQGNYRVRFTAVGDSAGSYVYDDSSYAYRYVGSGRGGYAPVIRVLLPTRTELAVLSMGSRFGPATVTAEAAGLRRRRNLFASGGSARDDGALALGAAIGDSTLGAEYARRMSTGGYRLPGAESEPDFGFRWGTADRTEVRSLDELACHWRPSRSLTGNIAVGRAGTESGRPLSLVDAKLRAGFADLWLLRNSCALRWGGGLVPSIGPVSPSTGFFTVDSSGLRRTGVTLGVSARPGPAANCAVTYRRDWSGSAGRGLLPGDAVVERQWFQSSAAWEARTWRTRFVGLLSLPSQVGDSLSRTTRLSGTLTAAWFPATGLRLQAEATQSYRRQERYDELFSYVGPGLGGFERDTAGGYFPVSGGSYTRSLVPSGTMVSGREQTVTGSGEISLFRPLAFTMSVNDARNKAPGSATATTSFNANARLSRPLAGLSPSGGLDAEFFSDPGLPATGGRRTRQRVYVEFGHAVQSGVFVQSRVEAYRREGGSSAGLSSARQAGISVETRPDIEGLLDGRVGLDRRRVVFGLTSMPDTTWLTALQAGVGRSITLGGRTRLRAAAGLVWRTATAAALPYELSATEPLGLTPDASVSVERNLGDRLHGSLRYSFLDRPARAAEHVLEATLRVTF